MQVTVHCLIVYAYQILPHLTVEAYMYIYEYIKAYIYEIKKMNTTRIFIKEAICVLKMYSLYICFTPAKMIPHTYPVNVNAVSCLSGTRI